MDIASLLAEADKEVDYDKDEFEDTEKLQEVINRQASDDPQHSAPSPRKPGTASILQAAAQVIAKEEREEAAQLFQTAAREVVAEVNRTQDPDAAALEILVEASKDVNELHNIPNPLSPPESEAESEPDELDQEDDAEYDTEASRDLLFACSNGQADTVRKLLRKNANLLHKDRHGWTGLHWAASRGHLEVIEELAHFRKSTGKKLRPFLHIQDQLAGWTPLHVRPVLLSVCGDTVPTVSLFSPWLTDGIQVACVSNQRGAAKLLLELGASKRKVDRMKERPVDVIGGQKNSRALRALFVKEEEEEEDAEPADSGAARRGGEEKSAERTSLRRDRPEDDRRRQRYQSSESPPRR